MPHTQLIISPEMKHKIDKYVRYVNIVNVVLFTKISIVDVTVGFLYRILQQNPL